MRIYVDEEAARNWLLEELTTAGKANGFEVVPPRKGMLDPDIWALAQQSRWTVLTFNGKDFRPLAKATPGHHGLLVVMKENNTLVDLNVHDIVQGVVRIAETYRSVGVTEMVLTVNKFVW